MYHPWEDPSLQHENRLPARASFCYYDTEEKALVGEETASSFYQLLNGEWDFKLIPTPLLLFEENGLDFTKTAFLPDESWGRIKVPGCWQMQGYGGHPVYSGSPYLFPVEPPYVAEDNDTGLYRRTFTLPESMLGKRVFLRFEGVGCMFYAYLNGQKIGMSKGSHMTAEFDVTDLLVPGENVLAAAVLRFCDGSYIEIQDMYHMSGIFRNVSLLAAPKDACIKDVYVTAGMDGKLRAEVKGAKVRVALYDGREKVCEMTEEDLEPVCKSKPMPEDFLTSKPTSEGIRENGPSEEHADALPEDGQSFTFSMEIPDVKRWSAETPNLYTLVLQAGESYIPVRVGFRTIERRGPEILVNGLPIKARGVNHHDTNTDNGWAVGREALEQDVLLMKQNNINFVRTSHYPSDAYFYDLADRYGLYILDEADIECHGMTCIDWDMLSKSPDWRYAYTDRVERMVLRDRNHPSVFAWSLGNESGFGENHVASSEAAKALDGRLVHYQAARVMPHYTTEEMMEDPEKVYALREAMDKAPWHPCTDFESTMYPQVDKLRAFAERDDDRPFFVCEYAHSMGNSPGNLKEYWELIYAYPKLFGACVWEWQDHGLRAFTADGKQYFAGGNDYGMPFELHGANGNFCNDGLISSEKIPHPAVTELRKVYQPAYFELAGTEPLTVRVITHDSFVPGRTEGLYEILKDGKCIAEGILPVGNQAPLTEEEYRIPAEIPEGESFLNIRFTLKDSTTWAPAGHLIASDQFVLGESLTPGQPSACSEKKLKGEKKGLHYLISGEDFELSFDLVHGTIESYRKSGRELLLSPLRQNFWHAPTDNDISFGHGICERWLGRGVDRLVPRNTEEPEIRTSENEISLTFRQRFGANPTPAFLDTVVTYSVDAGGEITVRADYHENPYPRAGKEDFWWPRLGFTMGLPKECTWVSWHGRGPGENYVDRAWASDIGWYRKTVPEMHTSYARMQANGTRTDTRTLLVSDSEGTGFRYTAVSAPFSFTVHDYTDEALTAAWHEYQLQKADYTVVDIDLAETGIGSNSCGPEPLPQYRLYLKDRDRSFSFRIKMCEK